MSDRIKALFEFIKYQFNYLPYNIVLVTKLRGFALLHSLRGVLTVAACVLITPCTKLIDIK